MEDGGYYAIKGFDFQIDKTILALFDKVNVSKQVEIEQIQDLSANDVVIQVKYKETQAFSNAKIREPVLKLIEDSLLGGADKSYVLYCHFLDRVAEVEKISKSKLDQILEIKVEDDSSEAHQALAARITKITNKSRTGFAKKFTLQFAENYHDQFLLALKAISQQDFCNSNAEAIFYYGYIADYLRKIVITNPDRSKRVCNQKQLINSIVDGKSLMFYTSFSEYESRDKFLRFIKPLVPILYPNQANVIVIGEDYSGTAEQLADSLNNMLECYFKKATYDVKPPTIFVSDHNILNVKIALVRLGVVINDGFEQINFNLALFLRNSLVIRKTSGMKASDSMASISFRARIVSLSRIGKISQEMTTPDRVLYLGSVEVPLWNDIPAFLVSSVGSAELPNFLRTQK